MYKIAVLIRCYKLTKYLKAVIKQYDWVDKILVMNYRFNNVEETKGDTESICKELGIECLKGCGLKQHEILNMGINKLNDYDCVFIVDADEFITRDDQNKLVRMCVLNNMSIICKIIDYTSFNESLPQRGHHPVVIVNPKNCTFNDVRNVSTPTFCTDEITMHHFGYAWKGEDLEWKRHNQWYTAFHEMMAQPRISVECPQEIRSLIESNCGITEI